MDEKFNDVKVSFFFNISNQNKLFSLLSFQHERVECVEKRLKDLAEKL